MDTPFTKYASRDTETLDQYESHDEFESNGPFNSEQHDHEFAGTYESYDSETEMIDQYSNDESEEFEDNSLSNELEFSNESESLENFNPLSEQEIAQEIELQVSVANGAKAKKPEGRTNWVKGALNRVLGLSLPDDNVLDAATKKAIGDFQTKNNLQSTQQVNAVTERALLEADALHRSKGTIPEAATIAVINTAKTKIEDWTKKAVVNFPHLVTHHYRDPRKVSALVLHHMAFKRRNPKTKKLSDPEYYRTTGAHFCIMFDGRIIQLHAFCRMIWHSNCTSIESVGVEFEGNFPDVKNHWWINKKDPKAVPNRDVPTQQQYDSGRFLVSYLKAVLNISQIFAHRQSSKDRENDPGPDIWYNVGQWAIDKLGLSDSGPSSHCKTTWVTIVPAWRTWADKTKPFVAKELSEAYEDHECSECKKRRQEEHEMHDHEDEYALGMEDEMEQEAQQHDETKNGFDSYYQTDEVGRDWSQAVKSNQRYGATLKWNQYIDKINDLLLPHSGMSNVSLGEEAFAEAVFNWQSKNGFSGNNVDGVIGPATWEVMRKKLPISSSQVQPKKFVNPNNIDEKYVGKTRFGQKKNGGWAAYGGGSLRDKLIALKTSGKLTISQNEIELFALVSEPESTGQICAINSWDNMGMSMGFLQFTIKSNELVELIKRVPHVFKKYNIELDYPRKYIWPDGSALAIKGAQTALDLRSFEWATRFFQAGLEDEVIIMQIAIAKEQLNAVLKRDDPNGFLTRFKDKHPNLWAFIYEAKNSRPAILKTALKKAVSSAQNQGITDHTRFATMLQNELKIATAQYYPTSPKKESELEKVQRVFDKTFLGKK